ncbi:MAG: thiamine pyrophosphate-binding protein, partial [Halodesulfurarchaeum sp.]
TAGNHARGFRHEEPILSGDVVRMARQFSTYSEEVLDVEALPTVLRRAVEVALTPPTGPVFVALPLDVMQAETDADPEPLGAIPDPGRGDPTAIDTAADALESAGEPVMVVGDEIARSGTDAVDAAVDLAEAIGARVHGEALGSETNFPASHEQWVSHLPPDESALRDLQDVDTVCFVGISTNTTLTAHHAPLLDSDTTVVHVGQKTWEIGKNHPADFAVLGDPGMVLRELADRLEDRISHTERKRRLEQVESVKAALGREMDRESTGDDTQSRLASKAELADAMFAAAPDAYVVDEGVTSKYELLARWPFEAEQFISNKGGGLGYGVPAAIGAAVAEGQRDEPRDVLGFVGDGTYLYYPQALYSAARYDLDLTVVISDNRNYRILKDNAGELFDADPDEVPLSGVDFDPPVDIPKNVESHGATGRLVESPDVIESAVRDGIDTDGPVVLDVLVHDD